MSVYKTCPTCGAHLDPGERCTDCKEKAADGASNTVSGKAEKGLHSTISAYYDTRITGRTQA